MAQFSLVTQVIVVSGECYLLYLEFEQSHSRIVRRTAQSVRTASDSCLNESKKMGWKTDRFWMQILTGHQYLDTYLRVNESICAFWLLKHWGNFLMRAVRTLVSLATNPPFVWVRGFKSIPLSGATWSQNLHWWAGSCDRSLFSFSTGAAPGMWQSGEVWWTRFPKANSIAMKGKFVKSNKIFLGPRFASVHPWWRMFSVL